MERVHINSEYKSVTDATMAHLYASTVIGHPRGQRDQHWGETGERTDINNDFKKWVL